MNDHARGVATLDAMVALAVLTLAIGAIAPIALGNQAFGAEARFRREAVATARAALGEARADAATDFGGVLPMTVERDGYRVALDVAQPDHWTKSVRATVAWPRDASPGRGRSVSLDTLVTNSELEETCDSFTTGDWRRPRIESYALADLIGEPVGAYPVTGLDAYDGRLYVTTSDSTAARPTLFVFDFSGFGAPLLLGKADNDASANSGPAAIVVAPRGDRVYAYLASASSFSRGQLQVADVTTPVTTEWQPVISTYKIPTSVVPAAGLGNAIAYRRAMIYLGLSSAPGGTEFNVIDVSDPARPVRVGGYPLGSHAANAITVRGRYAYVAHPMSASDAWPEQLTVLRVDDPNQPVRFGGFAYPGGIGGNGKSVAVVGDRAYLGRTASRISGAADALPELFALDTTRPDAVSAIPLAAAALPTPESVNALVVRDRLAFALAGWRLQIWDFAAAALPAPGALFPAPLPYTPHADAGEFLALPGRGTAMDCEGDVLYAASVDTSNVGYVSIITPS